MVQKADLQGEFRTQAVWERKKKKKEKSCMEKTNTVVT